jgi:hypothetical protein
VTKNGEIVATDAEKCRKIAAQAKIESRSGKLTIRCPQKRENSENDSRSRVARWFIFKPKMPLLVLLEGFGMENVGIFYGHRVI